MTEGGCIHPQQGIKYTVPPLLTDHLGTHGRWSDDRGCRMVGVLVLGAPNPPQKIINQRSGRYWAVVGCVYTYNVNFILKSFTNRVCVFYAYN